MGDHLPVWSDALPFICRHQNPRCKDDPCPRGISWMCNAAADSSLRQATHPQPTSEPTA